MRAVDIIAKKRDNILLSDEELKGFLESYLSGETTDYQMSAFLMAVYLNGLSEHELKTLTQTMRDSGELIELNGVERFLIDKHSTGGVGDKTSIALAPLLSVFGIGTAKMSGKGLGHTGGTLDKFEAIPGFKFPSTEEDMVKTIEHTGIGIMGQTENIVPLDKKLYALRDVTATVSSYPLIASSIMSKKLAVRSDGIILDVKVGDGAFMKNLADAQKLANIMRGIGEMFGRKVHIVLSGMEQPLGDGIGNGLEVYEAIESLKGNGPKDFERLITTITGIALLQKGDVNSIEEGVKLAEEKLQTGEAVKALRDFVEDCGGDPSFIENPEKFLTAKYTLEVKAEQDGYIASLMAEKVGNSAMLLGAGRETKEDEIDHAVGIVLKKKVGDKVTKGDTLAVMHYNKKNQKLEDAIALISSAYGYSDTLVSTPEVILDIQ
ncbi:thymidine phosphorylase [Flammeovirga kamogawensis]|uniref:thymidine phosphorylase n=1 Tax=Flammeovirga kamogawensis TaxID=373891 RepID=A0ABX8GWS8_9BACT|nr:thymidine phosphorylase [Flammeovirga kamogawensis]MBB6460700.1 pyrimidine-nucleoside phosphorylase [Flammeovirga kamogawensis]QWG08055.1 thymidine phosphorylase [Flammeovirga kamogawensis]TRX69860.1 thymidine phosphorylase [Flammeovirga kamogawensis]